MYRSSWLTLRTIAIDIKRSSECPGNVSETHNNKDLVAIPKKCQKASSCFDVFRAFKAPALVISTAGDNRQPPAGQLLTGRALIPPFGRPSLGEP